MSEEMNARNEQYIKGVALIKRSLGYARDDKVGEKNARDDKVGGKNARDDKAGEGRSG